MIVQNTRLKIWMVTEKLVRSRSSLRINFWTG